MIKSKIVKIGLFVGMALLFLVPVALQAQDVRLSSGQLEEIKSNCVSTQLLLSKLQKRDAVSRINRGRAYDLLVRQIVAFDTRLNYNKVELPMVQQMGTDIQTGVDKFRELYYTYDEVLSYAIKMDCKAAPQEFYDTIQTTRTDRTALGLQVTKLEDLTALYRAEVVKYQDTFKTGSAQ